MQRTNLVDVCDPAKRAVSVRALAALVITIASCFVAACDGGAARVAGARAEVRPDAPGGAELFRYAATDTVEHFDSAGGSFRIHFTRSGANAVPTADTDASGVPDTVERVAALYDEVRRVYVDELGFRAPPSDMGTSSGDGGDSRFDVYLLDFARSADGTFRTERCGTGAMADICSGYMVEENDFAGYGYPSAEIGHRVVASHEFFHAIQAGYDAHQDTVLSEGTAVWATERFDGSLNDFEALVDGYLEAPNRSIDVPGTGPVDPFSYGTAIFFRFLSERYADHIVRELLEDCVNGARGIDDPVWLPALEALLARSYATTFADAFAEFARWNLYTGRRADAAVAYDAGAGYPSVTMTDVTLPYEDSGPRFFHASAQYFRFTASGRSSVRVSLAPRRTETDTSGMRVYLASILGGRIDRVEGGTSATATLDTPLADQVVAIVVNTAREGDSRRPVFCIGDEAEVRDCTARLGAGTDGGVTEADAGIAADASATGSDGGTSGSHGDGGGCSVTRVVMPRDAAATHEHTWALGLALLALIAHRRRLR